MADPIAEFRGIDREWVAIRASDVLDYRPVEVVLYGSPDAALAIRVTRQRAGDVLIASDELPRLRELLGVSLG